MVHLATAPSGRPAWMCWPLPWSSSSMRSPVRVLRATAWGEAIRSMDQVRGERASWTSLSVLLNLTINRLCPWKFSRLRYAPQMDCISSGCNPEFSSWPPNAIQGFLPPRSVGHICRLVAIKHSGRSPRHAVLTQLLWRTELHDDSSLKQILISREEIEGIACLWRFTIFDRCPAVHISKLIVNMREKHF